jgi:hypothetical protein
LPLFAKAGRGTEPVVHKNEKNGTDEKFIPIPRDQSLRSPLKVAIIPTFRGIVAQVRIFGLEMPFLPFSTEIFSWNWHFCHFQLLSPLPFPLFLNRV